ncbi:PIN domain-containing protein [Methylocaldum sp.]|jgi:predicted nucleic acid-binding protein|uniref:PIN domain-containing protein n=1 Tax=Methylocaldum sp. TaxID=1969727 RepID=UPI0032204C49
MSNFAVVYDACVLYPAPLRDFLMWLALTDLYRAKWSEKIHQEWIRNLIAERPDLTIDQLNRTKQLMDNNVRDALVTGYEYLIPALDLPDPNDRHVLAAAIRSHSSLIVTFNLKDFPARELAKYDIEAIHPDDFILDLFDLDASKVLEAAASHRRSLKHPAKTVEDYLDTLLRQGIPETVSTLKSMSFAL